MIATESDGTKDIRSRQDEIYTKVTAYFESFVPGKVFSSHMKLITQEIIDADRWS